ncbi:MAG: hypothetical protein COS85_22520 [Armatimonadetes bacterium CG07_land_8_20_14_0_80_59_28]|nr:MAG: hypothetical protein COS85_22520 [Armatimonadetes bacterium CG07_land_8_20_14_0_80_59_28]PIX44601.1 MAG: hypothetical protein COZ56_04230 [Armatimonadetes bacterium CG_4_8_14_3_um_filter_58_9]
MSDRAGSRVWSNISTESGTVTLTCGASTGNRSATMNMRLTPTISGLYAITESPLPGAAQIRMIGKAR